MYSARIFKQLLSNSTYLLSVALLTVMFLSAGCGKNDMGTNYSSNTGGGGYNNNGGGTQGVNDIYLQGMTFSPANKTIAVGTTIKWTNKDSYTHTVTSGTTGYPSGLFDSGNLAPNGTFSYKFNQAGTYRYYCRIHSSMAGTITVQ